MNCVSSKSTDKKAKKGKSPSKKKQPETEQDRKESESSNHVANSNLEKPDSLSKDSKTKNGVEKEENGLRDVEEIINEKDGSECDEQTVMIKNDNGSVEKEQEENAVDGKSKVEHPSKERNGEEKKETENADLESASYVEKEQNSEQINFQEEHKDERTVKFTVQVEDFDSSFVVIDTPGETKDDLSDSVSVRTAESDNVTKQEIVKESQQMDPFTELADIHAINQTLRGSSDSSESDMEVTSELFLQYLNKDHKKHLKLTIRKAGWSLTDDIRSILWQNMCQHLYKADTDDVLNEYQETLFSDGPPEDMRVPSFVDVHHMPHYCLNKDGVRTVRQIMGVLEVTSPDIVYSPMLYPLTCLFLHYMDASQCYNCIYALLRNPAFISQTKVCYEASKLVIRDLTKRHAKSSYILLVRNCSSVDAVFDSWVWWVLKDLPFQYLVRVIDCYLLEGVKVLYRVTLSILINFTKSYGKKASIPKSDNSGNSAIISALRQFCQEMPVSIDKLLKTGFSIRGLRRKDIQKLQVKHEMYINSQRHLINNRDLTNQMPMSRSFSGPIVLQNLSSNTLTTDMLLAVWTWLPTRYAVCQPELLYTSEEHGTSLVTLYQRVENHQPTIIVIKTTTDEVFGAFCSTYWKERRSQSSNHLSYFGTGETFIFTLWPEKKKYQWVGLSGEDIPNTANMFQAGDRSILTIGGGHGEAIYLDENLLHCRTEKCDTFNNEPLSENEDFMCKVVEVYGFQ